MVRDSLTVDPISSTVATNGVKGYFYDTKDFKTEKLTIQSYEIIIGPKTLVLWSE